MILTYTGKDEDSISTSETHSNNLSDISSIQKGT